MANWLAAAHLDPFELTGSLRTKMGAFDEGEGGLRICPVRGPKSEADPNDASRFVIYSRCAKWVELTNILQRTKRLGEQMGGIEFGRIDLELLPAGTCMDWIIDRGEYAEQFERAIMILRTSPGLTLFAGPEAWMPQIGLLSIVSRRVPRSAINMGESPAIWLAVDFKRAVREEQP